MTGVTLKVDDAAVIAGLARVADAGLDPNDVLQNIGEYLRDAVQDRFDAEAGPGGVKWAPLNPLYAATKKGRGILRESGDLHENIVWQIIGGALHVGTNRLHARVHQFGATIKPKSAAALVFQLGTRVIHAASVTVPARPFLGIDDEDRREILDIVADHLAMVFEGAAGGP
ncbi:phage virion morphogenesis protein [Methylobrevis pamukkalensis]|uniref:Phage virion morphogenesis family protein n=1 Tax=Methylobrevis pamukkalensis TaxID=1439726 RepID=A0A1E3H4D0_9HYPH|nr:phage virion morphogenesis protein [Methylobrevis pamukkalensis]ODN71183.1 Phage virion morphogenesis family protein [Methylobrevis pamukkalensis]